jgi:hypothetical protein
MTQSVIHSTPSVRTGFEAEGEKSLEPGLKNNLAGKKRAAFTDK